MHLSTQQIEHIARLARLEVSDTEKQTYSEQLSAILDYVDQLQKIDTTGVEPTSQVTGLVNNNREDIVAESAVAQDLLATAPATRDGFITIPKVFDHK
jgi:aspartyl-tRNA(Asn)/glutamyl-tRNA(Gln) amidotransferase subunit C